LKGALGGPFLFVFASSEWQGYYAMSILENLKSIESSIANTAAAYGRRGEDIHLIAVSKQQPKEKIDAALAAGHRLYGENRVQEAAERWGAVKASFPDLRLHLIGPLQTNKVAAAVSLFDCIETLDRPKLVDVLAAEMKKQGRDLPCLIQVNTGEEEQKAGVIPRDFPALLDHARVAGISVEGLMCIPPINEPAGVHFAFLKSLADRHVLSVISMGMSGDCKKAIAAGATHVRIGSLLFGERGGAH
jgi:hypothetical protein